jgi:hypothetical protein
LRAASGDSILSMPATPVRRRAPNCIERFIGDRLTKRRLRFTAVTTIVVGSLLLLTSFATTVENRTRSGLGLGSDYLAFYNAGTILSDYGPQRLYDLELQSRVYHRNLPGEPPEAMLPYANAPFFALIMRPLAVLEYPRSYAVWVIASIVMYVLALSLVWRCAGLHERYWTLALMCGLSFEPFAIECLHGGQISPFGLLVISGAIYLSLTRRPFEAGLSLSVALYKPTLLPMVLPMLIVMRQWRTLSGFAAGAMILATLSVATVGTSACSEYVNLLIGYANRTGGSGLHGLRIWKFIDLNSFLKLMHVPSIVIWSVLLSVAGLVAREVWELRPRSAGEAQRNLPLAWATALTWTLVLNVYVGVYDSILVIPAILLTGAALLRRAGDTGRSLPLRFRCLLVALWALPWVSGLVARDVGLQPYTVALLALASYQLNLLKSRTLPRECGTGYHPVSSTVPHGLVARATSL